MATLKWETLETDGAPGHYYRARVPGGWLVCWANSVEGTYAYSGLTFYPDPNHEWDGS